MKKSNKLLLVEAEWENLMYFSLNCLLNPLQFHRHKQSKAIRHTMKCKISSRVLRALNYYCEVNLIKVATKFCRYLAIAKLYNFGYNGCAAPKIGYIK